MARKFRIEAFACLLWAFMVLVLPLRWLFAVAMAVLVHELCHWLALKALRVEILGVVVRGGGIRMETEPMTSGKELICALAGPAGGLVLLLFIRWIPRIAVIALVQSAFNLLPMYPLDGGRALRCVSQMLFQQKTADKICRGTRNICAAALGLMSIYCVVRLGIHLLLLVLVAYFLPMIMGWRENRRAAFLPWKQNGCHRRFR